MIKKGRYQFPDTETTDVLLVDFAICACLHGHS